MIEMAKQVIVSMLGHQDHGKSTLIGRLLFETKSVTEERIQEARDMSAKLGLDMEYCFLLDAFQEEREGGYTLDTTRAQLRHGNTIFELVDVPGHKEFIKNMLSGASNASAAILVASMKPGEGLQDETRLHVSLARLLGIKRLIVTINKVDLAEFDEAKYRAFCAELKEFLEAVGYDDEPLFIPVSSKLGDNVAEKSENTPWYDGPTVLEELSKIAGEEKGYGDLPLRLPVQDVYDGVIVGRVEAGSIHEGDSVEFTPSKRKATVTKLMRKGETVNVVRAGDNAGFEIDGDAEGLLDEVCSPAGSPPTIAKSITARVFCIAGHSIEKGKDYAFKCHNGEAKATVKEIPYKKDCRFFTEADAAEKLVEYELGSMELELSSELVIERFEDFAPFGRFVLLDGNAVVGVGTVDLLG